MILLIDNYDSFSFNLVQALGAAGAEVQCVRNDQETPDELLARNPAGLVLSPGPGLPESAGHCLELLRRAPESLPILGVCLGAQAIVQAFGGQLLNLKRPVHGRSTPVHHDGSALFEGLPSPLQAGRYHSWSADRSELPAELELAAWAEQGNVMGVRHVSRPIFGLQFHPESILTPLGERILDRFLGAAGQPISAGRRQPCS